LNCHVGAMLVFRVLCRITQSADAHRTEWSVLLISGLCSQTDVENVGQDKIKLSTTRRIRKLRFATQYNFIRHQPVTVQLHQG